MSKLKNFIGPREKISPQNMQDDFVTLASHQLRTPLSAAKWFCELLLSPRAGKLTRKQEGYVRGIYRSNERAITLVNDLLDVSRIQEGQIHLEVRLLAAEKIIEDVIDSNRGLIKFAKLAIDYEIVNGPLPKIATDPDKLRRVADHLLANAIKYTPAGGKIRVALEKKGGNLIVSVTDSGVGIPKREQPRVFDKFFRSPNIMKLAPEGTGLGLFIAKSLVEIMGGKIGFTSEEGKGTVFHFTLPFKT